jgi:hypothetical protein
VSYISRYAVFDGMDIHFENLMGDPELLMQQRLMKLACAAIWILPVAGFANDAVETRSRSAALESITTDELRDHVNVLADDSFEGREAGSRGGYAAAGYLVEYFKKYGLEGAGDNGSYFQAFGDGYRNILGLIEGRDPELRHEIIIVGAHYDHVGYGTQRNSYGPLGYIHNGADDNASGTAGLIETIEAFSQLPQRPRRTILFALWDGEEQGLVGSKHWIANPTVDFANVCFKINCDMIGRLRDNRVMVYGTRTSEGLRRMVSESNGDVGFDVDFTWELKGNSDHYPFFEKGIPILMLHTGLHDDYHRPRDDAHKIDSDGIRRVAHLLFNIMLDLGERDSLNSFRTASRDESPDNQKVFERPMQARPSRLGISWRELDGVDGIVITRVNHDSPAHQAGLQQSDRIVEFNGQKVIDGLQFLSDVQASPEEATFKVQRDGNDKPIEIAAKLFGKPVRVGISWREDDAEPGSLMIARVVPGTPAYKQDLRVGDRVYEINGQQFKDGIEFADLVSQAADSTELLVERKGRIRTVKLDIPPVKQEVVSAE